MEKNLKYRAGLVFLMSLLFVLNANADSSSETLENGRWEFVVLAGEGSSQSYTVTSLKFWNGTVLVYEQVYHDLSVRTEEGVTGWPIASGSYWVSGKQLRLNLESRTDSGVRHVEALRLYPGGLVDMQDPARIFTHLPR